MKKRKAKNLIERHLYDVWRMMIQRCTRPQSPAWSSYGGRGIQVSRRWLKFENFLTDMKESYVPGLTLDRRNNDKGYTKKNCRWVTYKIQANNTRANVRISTPWGQLTQKQAAERTGINDNTISVRRAQGWSEDRLLEPPTAGKAIFIPTPWGLLTVAEAARRAGIKKGTLGVRRSRGWPESRWLEPVVDRTRRSVILHGRDSQTPGLSAQANEEVISRSHK